MRLHADDHIHIVGIGGSGMSALATILLQRSYQVSGSDLRDSNTLTRLRAEGATVYVGHEASHIGDSNVVAYSSAVAKSNPEIVEAQRRSVKVVSRAELLEALVHGHKAVLVGGTHGKTTTTSMISLALLSADIDPSYVVGGELNEIGASARSGEGEYFVVEADESDGTFLALDPYLCVLTNVEPDHLDHFGNVDNLMAEFRRFLVSSKRRPIVCIDDKGARKVSEGLDVLYYGTSDDAELRIRNLALAPHLTTFEVFQGTNRLGQVDLPVPGIHNARNATAAVAAGITMGVEFSAIALSLSRYLGVARRFQLKRTEGGVRFFDDYAHLPAEIAATLQSARQMSPSRVVAVFQPHRYSRTRDQAKELGYALGAADLAVVTEIYGAGELPIPGVSARQVFEAARELLGDRVIYEPHRADVAKTVAGLLTSGDLCISMGAGDIATLENEIALTESCEKGE